MNRRQVALLAIVAALATGCGSDNIASDTTLFDTSSDDSAEVLDTASTEPRAEQFKPVSTWRFQFATDSGYITEGTLSLGAAGHPNEVAVLPGFEDPTTSIASYCADFDPQSDALIAAQVLLRNETDDFANELSVTFFAATANTEPLAEPWGISVAAGYAAGTECYSLGTANDAFFSHGNGWGISFTEPIQPGVEAGPHSAYLIVDDYFTPASPNGDPSILSNLGLAIAAGLRGDDADLVSLSGPDVIGPTQNYETKILLLTTTAP